MSRRQWQLLAVLAKGPTTAAALNDALAPFLDLDAGETALASLEPLIARGAVAATDDSYALTTVGVTLHDTLLADVQAIRDLVVRGLGPGDYDRTIASLQTMIENLRSPVRSG